MKKIFSVLLSVVFLFSAMGVTINSHYCGMKLKSVSLTAKGCCCKKNVKMPKDCCKNEIKYVKITDDYSPASQFYVEKIDVLPTIFSFVYSSAISHLPSSLFFENHSPPPGFDDRVIAFRSILI
ncbi:MAG: hypothetical protein EPN85_14780 [Bacteroidetes bacterium]|nr:MAG: hypothetical protein EPN85_14780 [Bacteroidota bacterium]